MDVLRGEVHSGGGVHDGEGDSGICGGGGR